MKAFNYQQLHNCAIGPVEFAQSGEPLVCKTQYFSISRDMKMRNHLRLKLAFLTFVLLSAFATCNAQPVDKNVVIERLIASTREIIASPDSPSMRMALEPVKKANMAVPESKWLEFQANVVAIMREEILKTGSPAYVKLKTRLQLLSLEEVVELSAMLGSPAYKKYQTALADREISEGTLGSLMAAWSRIAESAKQSGIRIN